ncbi:hypothetical protein BCR42DRAFT_215154 [Absidia repens]|uniref:Uncharacterized protein n=1 Tax=Absidia repens TaxID=90262 RepID=A0A1X2HH71_9FUNG|nr:hypothetical protein BCR42DRAFT_215154 [Absidia repens]
MSTVAKKKRQTCNRNIFYFFYGRLYLVAYELDFSASVALIKLYILWIKLVITLRIALGDIFGIVFVNKNIYIYILYILSFLVFVNAHTTTHIYIYMYIYCISVLYCLCFNVCLSCSLSLK